MAPLARPEYRNHRSQHPINLISRIFIIIMDIDSRSIAKAEAIANAKQKRPQAIWTRAK